MIFNGVVRLLRDVGLVGLKLLKLIYSSRFREGRRRALKSHNERRPKRVGIVDNLLSNTHRSAHFPFPMSVRCLNRIAQVLDKALKYSCCELETFLQKLAKNPAAQQLETDLNFERLFCRSLTTSYFELFHGFIDFFSAFFTFSTSLLFHFFTSFYFLLAQRLYLVVCPSCAFTCM